MLFPKDMPGYMGMAYDFNVNGSFDEAVISFRFDKTNLPNDAEPTIYYYNEKEGSLEELPTTVVGNIASAKVNHFSTYILINRTIYDKIFPWVGAWEDEWEESNYNKVDIAFIIDDSYSMKDNDPNNERLEAARNLIDKLPSGSGIGVVSFSDSKPNLLTSELTTNKEKAKKFLTTDYFTSGGNTYMYSAISGAFPLFDNSKKDTFKMMVVLSDGETVDANLHKGVIDTAKNKDIRMYTVGLGSSSSSYFNLYLKPLAENTKGKYYYIRLAKDIDEAFNNINKKIDITIDNDKDGLPDYYEDSFKLLNGKTIITDKDNPDTDGDDLKDGEEVKVKYEYSKDRKKVRVKGYMISDPTIKDSDGDGDLDKDDPNKMRYLLNDRFIDNLGKLEEISKKYTNKKEYNKYPFGKDRWYVFMFIRQFNPNYTKEKWIGTGGKIDTKFVDYVKSKDEELYKYFATKKEIYANKKFETLDLYHMAATLTGIMYDTDSSDVKYLFKNPDDLKAIGLNVFPENIIDDQAGWAGDIHTLMNDTMKKIKDKKEDKNKNTKYVPKYKEFYDTFSALLGDKNYSFGSDDIFADVDAYNIGKKLENKDTKSIFFSYYSEGYKKRFTNFLDNADGYVLDGMVYFFTKETYLDSIKWPLLDYDFNYDHSKAARDVFVEFIIAQRGKE